MNTFKRKALFTAVLAGIGAAYSNVVAGVKTAGYFALAPLHDMYYNPRNGFVKFDGPSEEIKALGDSVTKKFGEFKEAQEQSRAAIDQARKELKEGKEAIEAKTADALKTTGENVVKVQTELKEMSEKWAARILEVEQKLVKTPSSENPGSIKSAGELFAASDELKGFISKKEKNSTPVDVQRKSIVNATFNNDQPLVASNRLQGLVAPPQRRLTVRQLMPNIPTTSNVIEFARELVFTNAAAPQGAGVSPTGHGEGQPKAESMITFELVNAVVITIAHWIPVSRQVLHDAPALAGYIDSRLGYGLALEEEDELLNGSAAAGELMGLRGQATAFSGGVTNAQALDTLLRAFTQVELADYEPDGVVLHPTDWMNIRLLKDTTGRYLFSDPHSVEQPRVWGKNLVPTSSMTQGQFLTGAFALGAAIYDREGANIRLAEQHDDFFVKNMVAILCEERLTLVVYRPAAFVAGALSYTG